MSRTPRICRTASVPLLLALAVVCGGGDLPAAAQPIETAAPIDTTAPTGHAESRLESEQLVGVWYEDPGTGYWQEPNLARFSADGTFAIGGAFDWEAWLTGTYSVEGRRITFDSVGGGCGGHVRFSWDLTLVADGRFESVHAGSDGTDPGKLGWCSVPVGEPYNYSRISPTSEAAGDITTFERQFAPIGPDTPVTALSGYWLVEGTGHLLMWERTRYWLDDTGVIATSARDIGTAEIGTETLTFTSNEGAQGCAAGDVMVWESVHLENGKLLAQVAADSCDRGLPSDVTLVWLGVHSL